MSPEQIVQFRQELSAGRVTPEFYQLVYLPYAQGVQARAVESLQRVSKGKVSASVLMGMKAANAPLNFRALADSVAVMPPEQLEQYVAQVFEKVAAGGT